MDTLTALENMDLFRELPRKFLESMARVAVLKQYGKGKELFVAGSPASGFYGVVSGKVRIYRSSLSGKEQILHVFGPGEIFGEVAVFQGGTFPASAQAMEKSEFIFLPRDQFRKLVAEDPDLALKMMGILAGRLRMFVKKIEELSLKEVPARLAAHLLLLRESQNSDSFSLDLPKGQIAAYLGTIQETLSRVLKKLSEDRVIAVQGREISILDPERLEEIAETVR